MIHRKNGDVLADCDGCGEECPEVFESFSNPSVWVCEKCLEEDFKEAFENWKAEHFIDLEDEERRQDEQARIEAEEQNRAMREDD